MARSLRHLFLVLICLSIPFGAEPAPACIEKLKEFSRIAWSWWRVPEVRKFSNEKYQAALKKYREVDHPEARDLPANFEEKIAFMDVLSEHLEEDFGIGGLDFSRAMQAKTPFKTKPTATQKYIGRTLREIDFENGVSEARLRMAIEDLSFLARGDPFRLREFLKRRSNTKKHFADQALAVAYEKELLIELLEQHGKIIPPTKWERLSEKYGWVKEVFLTLFYNSDIGATLFPLYLPRLGISSRWISKEEAAAALRGDEKAIESHQINKAKVNSKLDHYGNYMIFRSFANKVSLLVLALVLFSNATTEMQEEASKNGSELILQAHQVMAKYETEKITVEKVKALRLEIESARKENFHRKQVVIAASTLALAIFYLGSSKVMTWSARHYVRVFMRLAIMLSLLTGKEARIEASQADQLIKSLQQIELEIEHDTKP